MSSIFINNVAIARGGAISSAKGNTSLINCDFFNNTANGPGGAIHVWNYPRPIAVTNINISNCNFINNRVTSNNSGGGALAFYDYGNRSIKNCTFVNNTSNSLNSWYTGGAIYSQGGYLNISKSTFNNNTCFLGGAIHNDGIVEIESCNIFNNYNALLCRTGNMTIKYSRIFNNTGWDIGLMSNPNAGIYSMVNASYNWWGTNNPDLETSANGRIRGTGIYIIENYFVMDVVNLTALDHNKNIIFKYKLRLNNSEEADTSLLPYFETSFYNNITGLIVSFDARFNKTLTYTVNAKNKTIGYDFTTDNQTSSFEGYIDPGITKITVNSPTGKNGEIVDIIAKLTDDEGNPLANKEIIIIIKGKQYRSTTNSEGIAIIEYTINESDFINNILDMSVLFEADSEYYQSNETGTITLIQDPTPTPTPTPTPIPEPNNNTTNNPTTHAAMKTTGIPIMAIFLVLLSSLGIIVRKK